MELEPPVIFPLGTDISGARAVDVAVYCQLCWLCRRAWGTLLPFNLVNTDLLRHSSAQHQAPNISRRDSTRSIKGRMTKSLEMARDSSSRMQKVLVNWR